MAEPEAAPPSAAAAAEQDVLLATKLHVPAARPGFVARPRLAGALGEALARRLVLVCAPAGFGKTALLANWVGLAIVGWLGCHWILPMTTRCGSGGMWWLRWTGRGRGSASGSPHCSARRHRHPSRDW